MTADDETQSQNLSNCSYCKFGLIVTGDGEREFLPDLFSTLAKHAGCSFEVVTQIGQRRAVTNRNRLKIVGQQQRIPTKDETEISLKVRGFLRDKPCRFLILVDDVEHDRIPHLPGILNRYRTAIDTMLRPDEKHRASVHFLANMVEAYYFADVQAVNRSLNANVISANHEGDVELIRHPKNHLKELAKAAGLSFDEKSDGAKIISELDVDRVLSDPNTCGYLRSMFAWCVQKLMKNCPIWNSQISNLYCLVGGKQAELTKNQD